MDIETLRRYQQYKAAAAALSDEIDSMYYRPSAAAGSSGDPETGS